MALEIGQDGLVVGRACGACTLCCKVYDVSWLDKPKPAGKWCHHCVPGKGCQIWQNVPEKCASYFCNWRKSTQIGEEWRPDRAGFLINQSAAHLPFEVVVDPGKPDAWRKEPYFSALKGAAALAVARQQVVLVVTGKRHTILLPDGEVAVPIGLENTDFHLSQAPDGRWHVRFLGATQSA